MRKPSASLLTTILLSALLLSLAGAAVSGATAQGAGRIAYTAADGSLWLVDATGADRLQLTGPEGFALAAWSPDGERLALVKGGLPWAEGNEIHVVNADGSGLQKVADGYGPVWSEDSQEILYVTNFSSSEQGTEQSLKARRLQDGSDRILATRRWISGLWPIEKLWYSSAAQMMALYVAGLEMEGHVVLTDVEGNVLWEISDYVYSADNLDWSPDGKYIVYRDSGDPFIGGREPALKILRAEDQKLISSLPQAGFWPRWSPNGQKMAIFLWQGEGDFSVTILSADGREVLAQEDRVFGDIWSSRPYWSPDSSQLVLPSVDGDETRIYLVNELGDLYPIAEGTHPEVSWSPDSTQIALALGEEERREIYVVNRDGSNLRKLADGRAPRWRPTVSPAQPATQFCGISTLGSLLALGLVLAVGVSPRRRSRRVTAVRDDSHAA